MRILHAIHDFLPRHQAGSEIYAFELCRELAAAHHVTVLCAEYDPSRRHGHVTWRVHEGLPVVEIVNNWVCGSFEDTYRPPLIRRSDRGCAARGAAGRHPRPQPAQSLVRSAGRGAGARHSGRRDAARLRARVPVRRSADPSRRAARLRRHRHRAMRALLSASRRIHAHIAFGRLAAATRAARTGASRGCRDAAPVSRARGTGRRAPHAARRRSGRPGTTSTSGWRQRDACSTRSICSWRLRRRSRGSSSGSASTPRRSGSRTTASCLCVADLGRGTA